MFIALKTFRNDRLGWIKPAMEIDPSKLTESEREHYIQHKMIQDKNLFAEDQKKRSAGTKSNATAKSKDKAKAKSRAPAENK